MQNGNLKTIFLALTLAMASGGAWVYAQAPQSQILGIVIDPSGLAVPGATVVLRNEATGIQNTTITTSTGDYTFLYLDSGTYTVTVQKEGFDTVVFSGIEVQVLDKRRVDTQLKLGQVTTKVEVTGTAAKIDTDSAAVGATVSTREATDLPLNGREFSALAVMMPGVQTTGTSGQSGITAGASFATTLRIGGGTGYYGGGVASGGGSNAYNYDGVDNAWALIGGPAMNPSVDSIQEFRIDRSQMQAEFGRGHNQIEVVTRGGTNQLRGTLWEYLRNDATSAGEYYTHEVERLKRNQFGGNLGGPIRKNKAFFFVNYEGQILRSVSRQLGTVLTAKERNGDFSEFLDIDPALYQLHDPFTGEAYAGNIIPSDKINLISKGWADTYMPLPNISSGLQNNYLSNFMVKDDWHQVISRVDYTISNNDRVNFRFSGEPRSPITAGLDWGSEPTMVKSGYYSIGSSWQRNWTNSTLTEVRFGYHWEKSIQDVVKRTNIAELNPVGMTPGVPGLVYMNPYFVHLSAWWFPADYRFHSYDVVANLTHIRGGHTIKMGFERVTHSWTAPSGPNGHTYRLAFNGRYSGIGAADFMLGWPSSASTGDYGDKWIANANRGGPVTDLFIQDDWKATPRLTLNLGLRYDLIIPPGEANDILSMFDPGTGKIVVAGSQILPEYANPAVLEANPDLFTTAAAMGWPLHSMVKTSKLNFSPRIGFAFRPWTDNKTVIRGGYGMFYALREDDLTAFRWVASPYLQDSKSMVNTVPQPARSIDDPFAAVSGETGLPFAYWTERELKDPYMQQFSLGVQRELPWGMIGEMNLQDQHAIRLDDPNGVNWNQSRLGVSEFPYPNLSPSLVGNPASRHSRYRSLELLLRKNSRHYTFQLSYVWAKKIVSEQKMYVGEIWNGPYDYVPT